MADIIDHKFSVLIFLDRSAVTVKAEHHSDDWSDYVWLKVEEEWENEDGEVTQKKEQGVILTKDAAVSLGKSLICLSRLCRD